MKILVIYSDDWADEFTSEGFKLFTEDEWKEQKEILERVDWPQELYFGTNEYQEYSSLEDYMRCVKVREITDENAAFLANTFGNHLYGYGLFVMPQ